MTSRRAPLAHLTVLCAAVAVALSASPEAAARAQKPSVPEVIEGQYIVVYDQAVASTSVETTQREENLGFTAKLEFRRTLKGFAARLSAAQVRRLRADPEIAFVTPDRPVHAFGAVPLRAGEASPAGVRRVNAAGAWARESSDVAVAVIDSGVDLTHPDLNVVNGTNCVSPGAPAQDDNGHGTHVAGTIGARNNGAGVIGVAPGTRIYAVKVLDAAGSGAWSGVICGLDWVAANAASLGIKVANLSLGGPGSNDASCGATVGDVLHAAICRATQAGVLHVAAAGNSGWDIGDTPPDVPATYPEVLTVTAFTDTDGVPGGNGVVPSCKTDERDDSYAKFSNWATRPADAAHMVSAPGVCIVSTWPGGGYATSSGTSMAAPHVAGLAALCLGEGGAAGPCAGKSPAQMISLIRGEADSYSNVNPAYGFVGDPLRPNAWSDYFGYAVRVADDRTAPETRMVSAPVGVSRSTSASFEFAAASGHRFECRLDAGAWASCASPATYASLGDGTHVFDVRAIDFVGNVEATPERASFTVDTVPPDTHLTDGPSSLTNDSTPFFTFGATEPGASFECRMDAAAWAACASPYTTMTLPDGQHVFEVRSTDAAGSVDPVPGQRTFTIDATAPSARIQTGPSDPTKTRTPTFELAADEASARLECRVDAGAWTGCVSPHRTAELADGRHLFELRAVDEAGNSSALAGWAFTVDTTTAWTPPVASEPPPPVAPEPAVPAPPAADTLAPRLALTVSSRRLGAVRATGLRATITSNEPASASASLVLDGRTARRLGLSRGAPVVIGRATARLEAGKRTLVVRLGSRPRARLAAVRSISVTLRATVRDAAGNVTTVARRVTLRA